MEEGKGTKDANIIMLLFKNSNFLPDNNTMVAPKLQEGERNDVETENNQVWDAFNSINNKTSMVNSHVMEVEIDGGFSELIELKMKLTPSIDVSHSPQFVLRSRNCHYSA